MKGLVYILTRQDFIFFSFFATFTVAALVISGVGLLCFGFLAIRTRSQTVCIRECGGLMTYVVMLFTELNSGSSYSLAFGSRALLMI